MAIINRDYSQQHGFVVLCLIISIYVIAWKIHSIFSPSWDIIWLTEAAKRMLHGGTYSADFFETNPPLIFYLYLPPIGVSSIFNVALIPIFRGYIFLLSALSLFLCYSFANKIFALQDKLMVPVLLIALSACYLILPLYELGQRDHLLVMLAMPYLFAISYRLQGGIISLFAALAVGFLAGLGFSIKPHFLITPLLIELYCMMHKRNILYGWRPEVVALGGVASFYAASIIIFFPDYLSFIIPFSLRHYYAAMSAPWSLLFFSPLALFCWLPLLLWGVLKPRDEPLSTIFFLTLIGYLFSYFSQRNTFYYHLVPPLSLAILLSVLLLNVLLRHCCTSKKDYLFGALFASLLFMFPLFHWHTVYQAWAGHKQRINKLIVFMQTHAWHQPVYFLTTTMIYSFPSIYYAEAKLGSRFPFLWMVASLTQQANQDAATSLEDKNVLVHMICEDLQKNKPALVFIDESENKPYLTTTHFDYLNYLSQDARFTMEWKNYQYLTTIEQSGLYRLGVYSRVRKPMNI